MRESYLVPAVLVILGLGGCGKDPEVQSPPMRPVVRVVQAREEAWTPVLHTFGNVVQHSKADIYPSSAGTLEALFAEEGDLVRTGQVLARLDKTKLLISKDELLAESASRRTQVSLARERLVEAGKSVEGQFLALERSASTVEQAGVELEAAEKTYLSKQELFKAGGVPEAEMDRITTSWLNAKASLFQAQKDHESALIGFRDQDLLAAGMEVPENTGERRAAVITLNTRLVRAEVEVAQSALDAVLAQLRSLDTLLYEMEIRSPIDGTVAVRHLDLGERAEVDKPLFTILSLKEVYVQAEVGEKDLPSVQRGAGVTVTFETRPPLSLEGRVRFITPFLSTETRTARIRVELDNRSGRLSPGLFARLAVRTGRTRQALLLPAEGLVEASQGAAHVYVVRNQKVFKTEVTTGERSGERVVIEAGVRNGDLVVLNPSPLPDGTEVRVEKED